MAETQPKKTPRIRKGPETIRQRAEKSEAKRNRAPRLKKLSIAKKPFKKVSELGKKEYHPIKFKEGSKSHKILGRKVRLFPRYFSESWKELRQVSWPTRKEVIKLTFAVFIFALIFAAFVRAADFVFEEVIKKVVL